MNQELITIQKNNLPEGWNIYKMEEVCDLKTGGTPSKSHPEYFGGNIKWIVSGDVNKEFIYDVEGRITELGLKNSNARILPIDSVLIALNGQGNTRGTVAVLKIEATCNQSIISFTPKNREQLDYMFLFYYFKSVYQKLRNLTGDKERSGLSMRVLKPFPVIIPPIDMQKMIINRLEKQMAQIEMMKKETERQKDAAENIFQCCLREIYGNITQRKILKTLCMETDTRSPQKEPDKYFDYIDIGGIDNNIKCIVDTKKILGKNAPSRARNVVLQNDIILSTTRPNLNAVAIVGKDLSNQIASTGFCVLRCSWELFPKYLFYYSQSIEFINKLSDLVNGALYPAVTDKQVFQQEIPFVTLNQQKEIAKLLDKKSEEIVYLRNQIQNQLTAINQLPASILNEVFGKYPINS
jgi:type I restriction enzyme S subunit